MSNWNYESVSYNFCLTSNRWRACPEKKMKACSSGFLSRYTITWSLNMFLKKKKYNTFSIHRKNPPHPHHHLSLSLLFVPKVLCVSFSTEVSLPTYTLLLSSLNFCHSSRVSQVYSNSWAGAESHTSLRPVLILRCWRSQRQSQWQSQSKISQLGCKARMHSQGPGDMVLPRGLLCTKRALVIKAVHVI